MVIRFLNRLYIPPLQCAALGTAAGFYFLFNVHIAAAIAFLIVLLAAFFALFVLNLRITAVCAAAFTIGLVLGFCAANAGRNDINFGIPVNNVIAVEGVLLEDPRIVSSGSVMALLSLKQCAGSGGLRVTSSGEITVFFPQESAQKLREFGRGTTVFAEGAVRLQERGYSISARSLHIVKPASALEKIRTNIRLNLISRFSDKSWGGLALALLLGVRDNLDSDFTSLYRGAGLSYILALSGMHLAIITALISFLLKKPLGLKAAAITGAVFIIFYCLLVGPMPSLNRAALMYIIGILAILGALPKNTMSILALSFLIQLIVTPAAGNSLSFILSYLALAGILLIGQPLSSFFKGKLPDFILQPLCISVGAFLATAGVCSFTFGIIAPVGIIAGLVIVPLTTVFMIGSIIFLVFDILSLSFLFDLPLSFVYWLMELTASIAGNVTPISLNGALILFMSLVISLSVIILEHRRRAALLKLEPFLC